MSLLTRYTLPAERLRGCKWADNFESAALVEKSNGIITGVPVFSAANGVRLDGINDYLRFHLTGREFFHDPLSIVIRFTPEFAYDEVVVRYFFDADVGAGGARTFFSHDTGNYKISIGGIFIANITEATVAPFWLQGQRNVLIISGTTTNTDIWLNGNPILVSDASAWTISALYHFHVGAKYSGVQRFKGTFHRFQLYHAKLTADEVADISNNSTYTYDSEATAVWQFRTADHDPGNHRTLDSTGQGNHLTLGDGAGANEPIKTEKHGYRSTGTEYMLRASDGTFNPAGSFSIQCEIVPEDVSLVFPLFGGILAKIDPITFQQEAFALYWSSDFLTLSISDTGRADLGQASTVSVAARNRERYFVTAVYEYIGSGTSILRLHVNDYDVATTVNARGPIWLSTEPIRSFLGGTGAIRDLRYYDGVELTRMQHLDYMARQRQRVNQR